MLKRINKKNIYILLKEHFKREIYKYKIELNKDSIKIFDKKESILIYHLNDHFDESKNINHAINNIEVKIGSYGICNNKEDIIFWKNLNLCIIIYPINYKDEIKKLKDNQSNKMIVFIEENSIIKNKV